LGLVRRNAQVFIPLLLAPTLSKAEKEDLGSKGTIRLPGGRNGSAPRWRRWALILTEDPLSGDVKR
jgi:hypothetical protein